MDSPDARTTSGVKGGGRVLMGGGGVGSRIVTEVSD